MVEKVEEVSFLDRYQRISYSEDDVYFIPTRCPVPLPEGSLVLNKKVALNQTYYDEVKRLNDVFDSSLEDDVRLLTMNGEADDWIEICMRGPKCFRVTQLPFDELSFKYATPRLCLIEISETNEFKKKNPLCDYKKKKFIKEFYENLYKVCLK